MWTYNYTDELYHSDELYHYGIPGMKWGHRKARPVVNSTGRRFGMKQQTTVDKNSPEYKAQRKAKIKKAVKVGAAVAGTALAVYGVKKYNKFLTDKMSKDYMDRGEKYIKLGHRYKDLAKDSKKIMNGPLKSNPNLSLSYKNAQININKADYNKFNRQAKDLNSLGYKTFKKGLNGSFTIKEKADFSKKMVSDYLEDRSWQRYAKKRLKNRK